MTDPIQDRLRELTAPPAVPDPLSRVLARATRARRRRTALAMAVVVVAVVAVAAASQSLRPDVPRVAGDGEVVPWELRLAPQPAPFGPAEPAAETRPPCRAEQLSVRAEQARRESAPGRHPAVAVPVLVTNDGPACQLPPEAEGVVLDEDGRPLPVGVRIRTGPAYGPPPPLEPDAEASTELRWSSWCGGDVGRWTVAVEIAGRRTAADVPGDPAVPTCIAGTEDALYEFGLWTVLNEARQPASDPQAALKGTVTGPDRARLGEVLPMVLRLENPSRGPVSLQPCPTFTWSVSRDGPGSFLRSSPMLELNCPQAPAAVPAGGHVDFALELILSPALADGMLAPGTWWITPGVAGVPPRQITVEPAGPAPVSDPASCTWVVPPDAEPRAPGLPAPTAPRTPATRQAVLSTNRGPIAVALDAAAVPCAVQAFAHLANGGYWDGQQCYLLSTEPTFRNLDCGSSDLHGIRAGFLFPAEVHRDQDYPAGTVVLTFNESITHAGSIRILYGDAPTYADNFTILGKVTDGLEIVEQVAAGGQKNGDFSGPRLPLTIQSIELQ